VFAESGDAKDLEYQIKAEGLQTSSSAAYMNVRPLVVLTEMSVQRLCYDKHIRSPGVSGSGNGT